MKKQIILSAAVLFTAGMIFMTGCKKDDTTPPVITLTGNASLTSSLQASLSDPGATATDEEDGEVTVSSDWSSTNPNINMAGPYTITYTATDAAGNTATETRTVTIVNDAAAWAGTYLKTAITDSVFGDAQHTNFVQLYAWVNNCVITASTTVNNKVTIDPFLDYSNIAASQKITGTVTGTTISIASQTANSIGGNSHDHTFQGNGVMLSSSPFKVRLVTSDHDITSNSDAFDSVTMNQ